MADGSAQCTTPTEAQRLEDAQLKIEEDCLAEGQAKYYRIMDEHRTRGTEDSSAPVTQLMQRSVATLAQALTLKMGATGAGRRAKALPLIEGLPAEILAIHTLRTCLATVSSTQRSLSGCASTLGEAVLDEINYRKWAKQDAEQDTNGLAITQKHLDSKRSASQREQVMRRRFTLANVQGVQSWDHDTCVYVGIYLIEVMLASTSLFELHYPRVASTKTPACLRPTTETAAWLSAAHSRMALFYPTRLPMVVPPRQWEGSYGGGYLTDLGGRVPLVKSRNKTLIEAIEQVEMPVVYAAVNAIQRTAWQINNAVLAVAEECWASGIHVGSAMPHRDPLPVPPLHVPEGVEFHEWKTANYADYKAWAVRAAAVHSENESLVSKRVSCGDKLNIAGRFRDYAAIYFPHNLDFRGRVYPLPTHLNPQSDDLARGLLRFAEGKPITERGSWWLKVHVANCYGVDKVSFEDRVAWTDAHLDALLDSGLDPLGGDRFWMRADDPFQALAACMELVGVGVEGSAFVSHLPIPMDGTCNGLQNFSALLRDPVGGAATNLVPGPKPSDIYSEVAAVVQKQVHEDAAAGNEFALVWDGHINRKIVKQPVMTLPYGATEAGMRGQIEDALRKTHPGLFHNSKTWGACCYLAKVVYQAIGRVVVAAVGVMEWLGAVAKASASEDYPLFWTSPAGLPVVQDYRQDIGRTYEVYFGGKRVRLTVARAGTKLDRKRQRQGISPNLIHSFDAAHLMGVTVLAETNGIREFAMIHDSYGTHACNTDVLHACIREAFVEQYGRDLLREFRDEVMAQMPPDVAESLPPPPPSGDLDLAAIKGSRYFFA